MIVGVLDKNIDVYRQMTQTGIRLGEGLFGIVHAAGEAGMNVDAFAGILSEHSTTLALAFGSTTEGAKRFTGIMKEIRDQKLDKQFYNMGLTLHEYAEFTADYIELERLQGRHRQRNDASLAAGTMLYVQQLDKLAKVTGMQRKEAQAALERQALDKNWRSYLATLPEDMRTKMMTVMGIMEKVSPEFADSMRSMMMTGVPIGEVAQGLAAMHPELQPLIDQFKKSGDVQAFLDGLSEAGVSAGDMDKAIGDVRATLGLLGTDLATGSQELTKFTTVGEDYRQSQLDEADHYKTLQKKNQEAMLAFDGVIENTRAEIMSKLIDSKVFTEISEQMGKFVGWISSKDGIAAIQKATDWFVEKMNLIVEDFKNLSIGEMFDKYVWQPLKKAIVGESPGEAAMAEAKKTRDEAMEKINAEWKALGGNVGKSAEQLQAFADSKQKIEDDFAADVKAIETSVADGESGNKGLLGKMFSGVLEYLPSMETLGWGLGLVTAAVIAMGVAGLAASPGLLLIGAAFLSIGAAGVGVGYMVEKIAEAVTSLREDIELFSDMNTEKLSEVGNAMTPLTDSILTLAKAGFVANFINDGSFKKLADGIKEFEGIDSANLSKIGPAMASLQKGMAAFTGDGVMESIGKVFTSWISGKGDSGGQMQQMADNLKVFGDIDSDGLVAVGGAMEGIANFIDVMDDTNIKNVAAAVNELTAAMTGYAAQGNKLTADMQGSFTTAVTAIGGSGKGQSEQLVMVNNTLTQLLEATQAGNKVRVATKDAVEENA
jgi:hypothetical protein